MPGFNIQGSGTGSNPNHKVEFHRVHRWIIEDLGTASGGDPLRLYAQSVQLPSLTFDEEKIKSGASITYKIAKKANWQDFTIKFYDVYGLYKLFDTWQKRIWNQDTGIGRADQYKRSVILLLTDGEGNEKQKYTAFGAYPKSITHGDLSYASSEVKLLTVTYSYDFATVEFKDVGKGGTPSGGSVQNGGPPSFVGIGASADRLANQNEFQRQAANAAAVAAEGGQEDFNELDAEDQQEAINDARADLGFPPEFRSQAEIAADDN
jgi:hypothetical protein